MNICKNCGKEIEHGTICTRCLQSLGPILPDGIELDEQEYYNLWRSHNLCSKFSEFSCLECKDLERCKTEFTINMLEFQSGLKAKGQIIPELEKWMEQTYHELREEYNELPEYEYFLKEQPPFLRYDLEWIIRRRRRKKGS